MKNLSKKINNIKKTEISQELSSSYLDYAMSVIISRALPDVRDGLKPVQRRILYAMYNIGLKHDAKFRKSATVVGEVLGKYHPHGDQSVYDSAVRMAQDFNMRYCLIQGQGNMGSIDDPSEYAAMRYTEMRLSKIGEELLSDINKETVDFVPNYDGTRKEPVVLPAPFPQILANGSSGIAVGMATFIPPHNLSELMDACCYLLDKPDATVTEIFKFVKGPDFPTGGEIFGKQDIIQAYSQGKGAIIARGKAEILETKTGKMQIVISEIPYQVQKSNLLTQIAKLVQDKRILGIKNIRDESDKEGMRIVIDLKREISPQKVLNQLYKFTDLQKTFHFNMVALVDGIQPKLLNLIDILNYFISHRKEVVIRRTKYELNLAKNREHILEGLVKCLSKIDQVIKIIKNSKNREIAFKNLKKKFKLSDIQANAILETKLAALARLEREKIIQELKEIRKKIREYELILKSPKKVKEVLRKEFIKIKEDFGDKRKTKVHFEKVGEFSEEDLIEQKNVIISLTKGGFVKREDPERFKSQHRGGKGVSGIKTKGEDLVEHFVIANTHDDLLFFTDFGRVFKVKAYEIPQGGKTWQGRGIYNFLQISQSERVLNIVPLCQEEFERAKYLVMITKKGIIKKTSINFFKNIRASGLIAISLKKGDLLCEVSKSSGKDDIFLTTRKGMSIYFNEKQVRAMSRQASGIKAIKLKKDDQVVSMDVISQDLNKGQILLISENGFAKRTKLSNFKKQRRAGVGIKSAKITQKTGEICFSKILRNEEDLLVISKKGHIIRIKISQIPTLGRVTQGVRIMRLEQTDKIASAICI